MKNHFKLILVVSFLYCFSVIATISSCQNRTTTTDQNGGGTDKTFTKPEDAAKSSITVLTELATNPKMGGVTKLTPDQVKQLTVGTPITIIELSYDALLRANDSMPSPQASSEKSSLLYPLEINGTAMTTAIVHGAGNSWSLSSVGDNRYVSTFLTRKMQGNADIIEVPGLGVNFLRYKENETVLYISDTDIPEAEIAKDRPMGERQALQSLARYAKLFESKYGKDIKNKKFAD